MKKIIVYATGNDGEGYCQEIGQYDDWSDITIRVGLFDKETVITFNVEESEPL